MCFRRSDEFVGRDTPLNHGRHETSLLNQIPPQMKRYWYSNSDVKTQWGDLRRRQLNLNSWLTRS